MHKIFDTSNLNFETGEETEQSEIKQHSLLLEAGLQFCGMVYASAIYTPRRLGFKRRSYGRNKAFGHSNVGIWKNWEMKP